MSTSKHVDKFCLAAVALTLVLTILFMCVGSLGLAAATKSLKYESTLFDISYVHKIDVVMDDWDSFLETCENEEYSTCTVVVDGKKHKNVAIRAKGNTSLSSVRSMGSQRYSFKLEFDHYQTGKSLDGLDKLCLNNLIQDNTMMKDYLVYRMMADFGADSPLCSFAYLTVNGEDWGLYLAVEGIEDSFVARSYGSDSGELYKPDSMSFGGGRGRGRDFNFDDLDFDFGNGEEAAQETRPQGDIGQQGGFPGGGFPSQPGGDGQQGGFGGMGSDDVKLKYIDDDPESYPNIFDNAKTDVSASDQERLIASLKNLSAYTDLEDVLDTDEVLRYFVVHVFSCNGDSYTGSMIHNYYLHEKDGRLGMIPWDYNLAFGTFQGGNASSTVNESIDSPVSGSLDDRPMVGWIFSDESYTERYHSLFAEFLERWFSDGQLETLIAETAELIRPYVEKDPTKFCTTEEFEKGVTALTSFVSLRGEAVRRQLDGDSTAVATDGLNLFDMGSMGGGGKGGPGGDQPGGFPGGEGQSGGFPGGQFPGQHGGAFSGNGSGETSSERPDLPNGETPTAPTQNGEGFPQPGENEASSDGGAQGSGDPPQPSGAAPQTTGDPTGGNSADRPQPPGGIDLNGNAPTGSSQGRLWLLTGVSVLVLAAGIVIAVKKRY